MVKGLDRAVSIESIELLEKRRPRLVAFAESLGAEVVARELVPDRREEIVAALVRCADELDCDLILTTGGTGLAPDDVTPEARAARTASTERPICSGARSRMRWRS